jgi:hypothetical protein
LINAYWESKSSKRQSKYSDKLENGNFKKYSNEGYISNDFEEDFLVLLFIPVIVNQCVYMDFKRKLCTRWLLAENRESLKIKNQQE